VSKNIKTHAMGFFGDEILHLDECFSKQQQKLVLRFFFHLKNK
jgi:hypothetical protein